MSQWIVSNLHYIELGAWAGFIMFAAIVCLICADRVGKQG